MKIGRIASADVKHIISREDGKFRRVGNLKNKKKAIGIAKNFPNAKVLYNQQNGQKFYNIYKPVKYFHKGL